MRRFLLVFATAVLLAASLPVQAETLFRENFLNLDGWEPLSFPGQDDSTFETVLENGEPMLKVQTDKSNSAILFEQVINIHQFPKLRWRWKVSNIYKKGNLHESSGDDSPLRVFVLFDTGPEFESFLERVKFGIITAFYTKATPRSALIYLWSSQVRPERMCPDYDSACLMQVYEEEGPARVGQWVEEEVNMLEDYRKAFGMEPSPRAKIMVLSDSEDTGEKATSYIDYIEVFSDTPTQMLVSPEHTSEPPSLQQLGHEYEQLYGGGQEGDAQKTKAAEADTSEAVSPDPDTSVPAASGDDAARESAQDESGRPASARGEGKALGSGSGNGEKPIAADVTGQGG